MATAPTIRLSVVIMAYNEEPSLPHQMDRTLAFLRAHTAQYEVLVVDDGSTDGTADIVRRYAAEDPCVKLLSHERNYGMGRAIRTGYGAATLDWVTQLPADGQVNPQVLAEFIAKADQADIVLSVYDERGDGLKRRFLSSGYRVLGRVVLGTRADYTGTMLFRRELLDGAELHSETFFVNLEFPIRCLRRGVPHALVTFRPEPRTAGASKVATLRKIRLVFEEMVKMRWRDLTAGRMSAREPR